MNNYIKILIKMKEKKFKIKKKQKKKIIKLRYKKNLRKNLTIHLIKKLFFVSFLIISLIIFDKNKIVLKQYQASVLPEIKSYENNIKLNPSIFNEFRKINCENKLIEENQKFKKSYNPDISVVMTMYNQAHCIYKGLRSVQNQSLKNIEIIIIDDCSEDNSTEVIKEYQKEDPRIILILHDTNEGEIKSRTDGIRKAKGKYITIIDGDDALIHKDILKDSFFIAKKGKLDIVQFKGSGYSKGVSKNIVYNYFNKNVSNIIYQPELRTKFIDKKRFGINQYELINTVIWAKLVKNDVFQKVLKYIGTEFTDDYINEAEDLIMAVGIFHAAKSYYIMKEMGYYNSYDEKIKDIPKTNKRICKVNNKLKKFGLFKLYKFMVDKNNKDDKEKNTIINLMKRHNNAGIFQMDLDDRHYKIMFYVYDKMLGWNCWNEEERN